MSGGRQAVTPLTRRAVVTGILALVAAGCGSGGERGEVRGVVHRNGQPLADVVVTFVPDAGASPKAARASGVTNAQGRFRLRTEDQQEGAVVGPYRVIVEDLAVYSAPRAADGSVLR